MRLNSLHNALYAATKLLRAELIAVKLIPTHHVDWPSADVAVGETSRLTQFNWAEGSVAPSPVSIAGRNQPLFGVTDALTVYTQPKTRSVAIAVTVNETLLEAMPGQFLAHERRGSAPLPLGTLWFAISLEEDSHSLDTLLDPNGTSEILELILGVCSQSLWEIYRSAMLSRDSLTALPGPAELRHKLQINLAKLQPTQPEQQTLLAMVEIDNFSLLRRSRGTGAVDALVKDLATALTQSLRKNDGLFRFSDSVFAVTANIEKNASNNVLAKLESAWRVLASADHFAGLTLSIGYNLARDTKQENANQPASIPSATHFLIGAEHALSAARNAGGNQAVAATKDLQHDLSGTGQYAGGVFTSDPMKDYRNNRILWHTVSLIASGENPNDLCRSFVALLKDMFGVLRADVFLENNGELQPLVSQTTNSSGNNGATSIPLVSRGDTLGTLVIETEASLDDSDLVFLKAVADQIAGALDRLELAARQAVLNARQSASLRAEIQELKDTAQRNEAAGAEAPLIAESQRMRDVLAYVEKVAPTDASVLIMGESGAGKEVMAKAIVAASNRAEAPFITVDCSAIAHSLIDSELFGRVKGAFTGADEASPGRIAQADGGTLFLDEIGELPMDVQAKLLRFVQEKELIAVGDTRRRRIDARIICATNRDLLLESSQGRFRNDLYYRLQVLQVTVPPLRDRQADIVPLARSFAKRYSDQFGKTISGFTDEALRKISRHSWPGNVRELQNAIVRATLTAEGNIIDALDLQFGEELPSPEASVFISEHQVSSQPINHEPLRAPRHLEPLNSENQKRESLVASEPDSKAPDSATPDDWATLTSLLAGQVAALISESRLEAPVGRWLADTVVLTASTVSGGVARQAARLLGVPETTLRRQLNKARQNEDNPYQLMSQQWLTSLPALTELLKTLMVHNDDDVEFSEHCQMLLLQQVANHIGDDRKSGAALMGITPPTYARWLERYAIEPHPIAATIAPTTFKLEQKYS